MQIQTYPLPHAHQYFLDGAAEVDEIDYCTFLTVALYADRAEVAAIIDRPWTGPGRTITLSNGEQRELNFAPLAFRLQKCADLAALTDRILVQLPPERRGMLLWHAAAELPRRVVMLAETLAAWAINDETNGGCLKPFRDLIREDRHGNPTKKLARRLHARNWIRRYVKLNDSAHDLRRNVTATMRRLELTDRLIEDKEHDLFEDTQEQHERARRDGINLGETPEDRLRREDSELVRAFTADEPPVRIKRKVEMRRGQRKRRKVIKRAAIVAAALLGASTVSAFARGEPVILPGAEANLLVVRQASMAALGHGTLRVGLVSKDNQALAEICVYLDQTPALDQLVGFALYAASGCEREIVDAGNITHAYPGAESHPLLAERLKARAARVEAVHSGSNRSLTPGSHAFTIERANRYFAETKALWLEALALYAGGPALARAVMGAQT